MRLIFARSRTPGSYLIRLFTWSRWSHVGVIDGGLVIDTTLKRGVATTPLAAFLAEHSATEQIEVALPDEVAAHVWLEMQLGKKYDWTAIIGFVFRRPWGKKGRWFCSELVESALIVGGRRRFREDLNRITPRHSWMVSV